MKDFTVVSAAANSSRRSATFSKYSLATSAFQGDTMCESIPDDAALPGLAFNTPEPDNTPDAVCDASPEVEAIPSVEAAPPTFLVAALCGLLGNDSRLVFSLPRPETSVQPFREDENKSLLDGNQKTMPCKKGVLQTLQFLSNSNRRQGSLQFKNK